MVMERILRLLLYNCLSLIAASRALEVAVEANCDILCLTGTKVKSLTGRRYHVDRFDGRVAIHFGYSRGPLTNKSAGVAVVLGGQFSEKDVYRIYTS